MRASTTIRHLLRRTIPLELRQALAQIRRTRVDHAAGIEFGRTRGGETWPISIEISQPIMPSAMLEAKLVNLRRGAELLDKSVIEGGRTWSFWNQVGRPSVDNGFVEGRNIVDGSLVRQVGGGLCQLSSLVYHLAMLGGLEIIERHPHSIDIYKEEDRFTPLGADATIVWGFKDLRLRNPNGFAVSIGCSVEGSRLVGQVRAEQRMPEREVLFIRDYVSPDVVRVRTVVDGIASWDTEYEQRQGLDVAR